MFRRHALLVAVLSLLLGGTAARAQQLTIWHDLGDNGTKWFVAASEEFAKTHPGVTVRAISYPTDQWFGRCIGAINTNTAPDLIYNNYERVIRVAAQTHKIEDMKPILAAIADKAFLSPDDLRVATYAGHMIILPVQRVQMAFGVRKSWLDKVGENFPLTWDDTLRVGKKFQTEHPDGGTVPVFAFALEAANPRDLIHMLDLFTFGAGLRHTLIDENGKVVIDEPEHAKVLTEFMKVFTAYHMVPPDAVNYSFNEMYQVIEGGRAGMFRVGDWNVAKWVKQGPTGDFLVGPWPKFFADKQNAVVIGGMRGVAVPENSPHKALAEQFAAFLLGRQAQQASLNFVGAAVRKDLDTSALPAQSQQFAKPTWNLIAYDFPESAHPWYPQLEASFHKKLLAAIANPPADWAVFVKQTAAEMRAETKILAAKQG
ncbi:MAG TPA: extracellular solute-binding protein [Acetobacteraceae bacterium]|nr:extracellular solute-binding protein [Acetobacteraceae bacterium]